MPGWECSPVRWNLRLKRVWANSQSRGACTIDSHSKPFCLITLVGGLRSILASTGNRPASDREVAKHNSWRAWSYTQRPEKMETVAGKTSWGTSRGLALAKSTEVVLLQAWKAGRSVGRDAGLGWGCWELWGPLLLAPLSRWDEDHGHQLGEGCGGKVKGSLRRKVCSNQLREREPEFSQMWYEQSRSNSHS